MTGVLAGSITLKATAPLVPAGTTVTFTVVPGPATAVEYVSPNTTNLASGSTRDLFVYGIAMSANLRPSSVRILIL